MTPFATYQQQDSPLTLQQGLEEYYAINPNLIDASSCSNSEVATLFERHDVIHVVFGCSTSLHDETLADTWTIFGTSIKFLDYLGYLKYSETTDLLKEVKVSRMIKEFIEAIPDVFRVIRQTRKMSQKWDWANYHSHLEMPLGDLRRTYGIQVIAPPTPAAMSTVQA